MRNLTATFDRRAEEVDRLRTLLDQLPGFFWLAGGDGFMEYVSDDLRRFLHEVNQPLSGIITNASTCLRMLANDPPDIEGACETARRTIRDANRASEVIARLRALSGERVPVSENEGPGATFAFSVPPVPEEETPAGTNTTAVRKGRE